VVTLADMHPCVTRMAPWHQCLLRIALIPYLSDPTEAQGNLMGQKRERARSSPCIFLETQSDNMHTQAHTRHAHRGPASQCISSTLDAQTVLLLMSESCVLQLASLSFDFTAPGNLRTGTPNSPQSDPTNRSKYGFQEFDFEATNHF
jgi:hypothetical protein